MTLSDWFGPFALLDLNAELVCLPDRKLHLLTAAFLRRVWDRLPSHHTQIAVAATEKHADGLVTADELIRLRSADLLETCEPLWTNAGYLDEDLIGIGCPCCEQTRLTADYECQLAANGYRLDGVSAAVRSPAAGVLRAARFACEAVLWRARLADRSETEYREKAAQFDILCDVLGPEWATPDPRWPRWRTSDVRALARGIYADRAFDRMPILADALQDAGCDDECVLRHCREEKEHVRGCWVVDLALGLA